MNYSECAINTDLIPGKRDLSANFVDAKELFGEEFQSPCSPVQVLFLRKNRNLFTAGEDNLVFRGVNLYGEKQWNLISDRYLPERSVNIISQRYGKLCLLLYKAHGIRIDENGNLEDPPKFESIDDVDPVLMKSLQMVSPPAILNVHRWSIEEDLTLLKAVAVMGSMWAELRVKLIPHRDRGHLRKRYQVLERRVKATAARTVKHDKSLAAKMRAPANSINTAVSSTICKEQAPKGLVVNETKAGKAGISVPLAGIKKPLVLEVKEKNGPTAAKRRKTNPNVTVKPTAGGSKLPIMRLPAERKTRPPSKKSMIASGIPPPVQYPPYHHPPYMYQPGYHPHMMYHYYPQYYPPPVYADESSRVAYERLAQDSHQEWSQMSHMRTMMEKETESMVASTIVTQLAKSPDKPIHDTGARESEGKVNANPTELPKPSAFSDASHLQNTPVRLNSSGSSEDSRQLRQHPTMSLFPSPGTPMEQPSPSIRPSCSAQNSLNLHGTPSAIIRTFPHDSGSSPFVFRHSEFSQNGHSMDGYDLNGMFSSVAIEGHCESSAGMNFQLTDSRPIPEFDSTSLLLEHDMEAVSALNLLRSPTNSVLPSEGTINAVSTKKPKKSLFAAVVGNVEDRIEKGRKKNIGLR